MVNARLVAPIIGGNMLFAFRTPLRLAYALKFFEMFGMSIAPVSLPVYLPRAFDIRRTPFGIR